MPTETVDVEQLRKEVADLTRPRRQSADYQNGYESDELTPDLSTWERIEPGAVTAPWPTLPLAALYGLAGRVVKELDPTTEADPVAILVTFLTMFGNAVGRGPYVPVGDDRHGANLFVGLVGQTGSGRKGASQSGPLRLMRLANEEWATNRVMGGLSSGEGLLWAIRDPRSEPADDSSPVSEAS